MAEKRVRGCNFTNEECQCLCSAVGKYAHIIENKKTDKFTWVEKQRAWAKATDMYNATSKSSVPRTVSQLISKYETLKKSVRRRNAALKQYSYGTGGGPHKPPKFENEDVLDLVEVMMPVAAAGLLSRHDSDSVNNETYDTDTIGDAQVDDSAPGCSRPPTLSKPGSPVKSECEDADVNNSLDGDLEWDDVVGDYSLPVVDQPVVDDCAGPSTVKPPCKPQDWKAYSPAMLKRPTNPLLKTSSQSKGKGKANGSEGWAQRRRPQLPTFHEAAAASQNSAKFGCMAQSKRDLAQLQMELLQKESKLKIAHMVAIHEMDMKIKQAQLDLLIEQKKSEIARQQNFH